MTVAMLREHGVEVDDSEANRWAVAPGVVKPVDHLIEPDLSNAAPFLALAAVTGGRVVVRDWPASTTQAGDALREILAAAGLHGHPRRRRADRRRPGPARGHRRRPARPRRAHPGGGGAVRAGRRPQPPARRRAHPRPRDRPAGRAGHRARRPGRRRDRAPGRAVVPARHAARRRLPHLRRPPDGARRGDRRRGRGRRAGRERRDDQQDVPGLRRLLVRAVRVR